ncbi:hypothetical protein [Arenibacter echinorum]|uniref:hypothetical protein n=1 Tax=Arenibacter echinorum TaxID=440515 RepID=UPI0014767F3D|nr:hypothetical protein [Arenibacter echinorum]
MLSISAQNNTKEWRKCLRPNGVEDNTHLSVTGATLVGQLALDEMEKQKIKF